MKHLVALFWVVLTAVAAKAEPYQDRFVWVFGWGLNSDQDVAAITRLLETAGKNGINGAVVSFGLDTLCKQSPEYFQRLERVRRVCDDNKIELIPSLFSIGYGGGALAHNRNLAEGLPVVDAPFQAHSGQASFAAQNAGLFRNGGFEDFDGNKARNYNFHDQPGEISFIDKEVKHSGNTAMRLENFTANQHGHARVMQQVKVTPHRCYRLSLWVKTEAMQPASAFRVTVLANNRELAPREFHIPSTTDWRRISLVFNSLDLEQVNIYAGLWGGKQGKVWLDDFALEEIGPVNVLSRSGTPVAVRSGDGAKTYEEGKDYAPLKDPNLQPFRDEKEALVLKLLPDTRIKDGERLKVSWYHSMIIHDSQVTVCMAEPEVYEIFDHEAKLLAEKLRPRRVLLNMDEIRMGGTCKACAGRNMAELLGECITRQTAIIRRHNPGAEVYIWSDMLDPNHNARPNYYLVRGDYTGSWKHVPKDLRIAVWGGEPREKSLQFFADQGFSTLVACYYDADDLKDVRGWLELSRKVTGVRGFMYTPWTKKYDLLPDFAQLLK